MNIGRLLEQNSYCSFTKPFGRAMLWRKF